MQNEKRDKEQKQQDRNGIKHTDADNFFKTLHILHLTNFVW